MWDDYNGMHGGDGDGWLTLTLLFVLLVGVGVTLVLVVLHGPSRSTAGDQARPAEPDAERVLRHRFAAGEIDEDEFRRRLDTLREPVGERPGTA